MADSGKGDVGIEPLPGALFGALRSSGQNWSCYELVNQRQRILNSFFRLLLRS